MNYVYTVITMNFALTHDCRLGYSVNGNGRQSWQKGLVKGVTYTGTFLLISNVIMYLSHRRVSCHDLLIIIPYAFVIEHNVRCDCYVNGIIRRQIGGIMYTYRVHIIPNSFHQYFQCR